MTAVFLDRDDTLIQDTGYMYKPEEFAWKDGAEDSLRLFQQHGLPRIYRHQSRRHRQSVFH